MKTNAPEKVYLGRKQRHDKEIFHVFATPVENDDIEYTRTDVFIEKAKQWLRYNNDLIDGDVADYVESFENYMKGE